MKPVFDLIPEFILGDQIMCPKLVYHLPNRLKLPPDKTYHEWSYLFLQIIIFLPPPNTKKRNYLHTSILKRANKLDFKETSEAFKPTSKD